MKTKSTRFGLHRWMLLAALIGTFAAMALPSIAHAQDAAATAVATGPATLTDEIAAPAAASSLTLVQGLTALVVPVIVYAVRKVAPALPKLWLPVIAASLGALAEAISAFAGGHTTNVLLGVVLGLAGVGVREATKQLKAAAAPAA